MNITVVYKLCDAQIGEEIMKEFFVIHSITHHPTRKKKRPDRQKTIHNFSAAMAYTLLFIFYYHLIFLIVDSENELNVWPLSFVFQVTHLRDVHKIHWQEETFWQRFKVENVNATGKVVKKNIKTNRTLAANLIWTRVWSLRCLICTLRSDFEGGRTTFLQPEKRWVYSKNPPFFWDSNQKKI